MIGASKTDVILLINDVMQNKYGNSNAWHRRQLDRLVAFQKSGGKFWSRSRIRNRLHLYRIVLCEEKRTRTRYHTVSRLWFQRRRILQDSYFQFAPLRQGSSDGWDKIGAWNWHSDCRHFSDPTSSKSGNKCFLGCERDGQSGVVTCAWIHHQMHMKRWHTRRVDGRDRGRGCCVRQRVCRRRI